MTTDDEVIALAKKMVKEPETHYGYSDVGDTLVRYLQEKIDTKEALSDLHAYQADYERLRRNKELRGSI